MPVPLITERDFVDDTADITLRNIALPKGEDRIFFQEAGCREVRKAAGNIDFENERGRMALVKAEAHHGGGDFR